MRHHLAARLPAPASPASAGAAAPRARRQAPICFAVATLAVALALLCVALPATSRAATYLPPAGKLYAGVSAGNPLTYQSQTAAHAGVFQEFVTWGTSVDWALSQADQNRSRSMLAIQTAVSGGEAISPGAIARGGGDAWLTSLGASLAHRGRPVYVRLFAEMDAYWNPYSAYNANGTSRGADHSTQAFRQAWRRITLILRGGSVATLNTKLRGLGMPAVKASQATLPAAPVAMLWVPQVAGAPDTPQNAPIAYYPGADYVDWVGTDFYSKFPNWNGLNRFDRQFWVKPFVFGEWAIWGADNPTFVNQLFAWAGAHPQVRMLMYNQGYQPTGQLALGHYPASARAIAAQLRRSVFAPFTAEWSG
jgi:hypothetical protein